MKRKLAASFVLILGFTSCGKKIPQASSADTVYIGELGSSVIKMNMKFDHTGQTQSSALKFQANAWVRIPKAVFIKKGQVQEYSTRIYFNTYETVSHGHSSTLYCDYSSSRQTEDSDYSSVDGYKHIFGNCFEDINNDGVFEQLSYIPGDEVPIDQNNFLRLELIGSTDTLGVTEEVYSDIEVDWR